MGAELTADPQHQEGARINLTVDLSPGDCFTMCKELFSRLKDHEKEGIMEDYLKSKGISFNMCEDDKTD